MRAKNDCMRKHGCMEILKDHAFMQTFVHALVVKAN